MPYHIILWHFTDTVTQRINSTYQIISIYCMHGTCNYEHNDYENCRALPGKRISTCTENSAVIKFKLCCECFV